MEKHPHEKNARIRRCEHFNCPDFQKKLCKEDTFLTIAVPQLSMTSLFKYESRSIYTLNTLRPALHKAMLESLRRQFTAGTPGAGGTKGEIFRMYKFLDEVPYTDPKTQKTFKGKKHVVYIEHVPFSEYETKFKEKIKDEDWAMLNYLRSLPPRASFLDLFGDDPTNVLVGSGSRPQQQVALATPQPVAALTGPAESPQAQEDAAKTAANDPTLVQLCQELSDVNGGTPPNTEENRMKLVSKMSVPKAVDYLKERIRTSKKAKPVQDVIQTPVTKSVEAQVLPAGGLL
jgi:hypothetical protein